MRNTAVGACVVTALLFLQTVAAAQQKPRISFDEFFDFVTITAVKISPDGKAVVIGTRRADWEGERFRRDLWIYKEGRTAPTLLTYSGQDSDPEWSPDGKWIAFTRRAASPKIAEASSEKERTQVYVISPDGGEAFPVTRGEESAGSFAWSSDSTVLYFSTRTPWPKAKRDEMKKEWKDVERFREFDRGNVIARLKVTDALANSQSASAGNSAGRDCKGAEQCRPADNSNAKDTGETAETPGAQIITRTPYNVTEIVVSPDGKTVAFTTGPPSHRVEDPEDYDIYVVDGGGGQPRRLTKNRLPEGALRWSNDSRQLYFHVHGDIDAGYEQIQGRVYSIDIASKAVRRWGMGLAGSISDHDIASDGTVIGLATTGTEQQFFAQHGADGKAATLAGWPGTYSDFSLARRSSRVAFVYSSLQHPTEVYIAEATDKLRDAHPISSFNQLLTQRALPEGMPYKWKSDDGVEVEGMLIYPPGKFGAKHLRMFTLIHGGPAAADGNKFRADHYDWAILAATNDWLVFRPNYRGSVGYGDKFQRDISPQIVSKPGRDILAGIDALVRDGIADPNQLSIGGYSYGGYMTTWLITQTTRFKAAVSGAGAVEHAVNWGNDDLTYDDAWYLGGAPWEAQKVYNDEAALWQLNKVTTPTHIVSGGSDIRVAVAEAYVLERALHTLKVPSTLLIFPGEGHSLGNNPWHGKIKVREELKWLETYSSPATSSTASVGSQAGPGGRAK